MTAGECFIISRVEVLVVSEKLFQKQDSRKR